MLSMNGTLFETRKGSLLMNAEILSVGTELLLGHTVNTDTTIVARELSTIGINVLYCATVGDNPARLEEAVRQALSRSDILITTGGLGPTGDDLTKETVASAAGKKLVLHEESLWRIEEYFKGRTWGESQKKQALLPQGCTVLPNDVGTAPGCVFETDAGKLVVMLPGPPSELTPMLTRYAIPCLAGREQAVIVSENLHVFGMGEGSVAEMIDDLMQGANPTTATYAKENEMFVRVTARASTEEEARKMMKPLSEEIRRRIGSFVYANDCETLEELVVRELLRKGKTLATAESCTGGLLSKRITDVSGASQVFEMGAVTYANRIKEQVLGVSHQTLEEHGAVSPQTAAQMAEGIRRAAGSDLGIGITGIAGPGGGTPEKPVGLVYIALSDGETTWVRRMNPGSAGRPRSRSWQRNAAASHALDMVRRYLLGLGGLGAI